MAAQTSSRKQWRLCRGPKGNIQSLGWAEFGCPDSQVKLARELLADSGEDGIDKEEKNRLGVYWLLKASEKGHAEATAMLRECLNTGTGITEQNLGDVKLCLEMPQGEKLSREAAKELFLSLSQGENFITQSQLVKEISRFSGPVPMEAGSDWRECRMNIKLSEEMVVAGGSQHHRGELPTLLEVDPEHKRWSPLAVVAHSLASLPLLPQPYLLLALLSLCGLTSLLDKLPSLLYYSSLTLMLLSTCQILSKKWEYDQFKQWSCALVAWGCTEEVSAEAQWAHCRSNSTPFIVFLLALFINIMSSSYVPIPPYSEIASLSTLISLYVLYNFSWNKKRIDTFAVLAFIIHLIARYPYEIDTFVYHYWRYLDVHVPTFTSYVVGSSIEFCLNLRVVLYLMLPAIFLRLAARESWLGVYTSLLPMLVSLSWWQLAVSASKGATQFGVIRSCLGVVLMAVFLPLSSVTAVLFPLIAVSKFLLTYQFSPQLSLSIITFISILLYAAKYKKHRRILHVLQILLSVASILFIFNCGDNEMIRVDRKLSWEEWSRACSGGDIASGEQCAELSGLHVSAEGRVLSTKVSSVYNPLHSLILLLPPNLQSTVACVLGETSGGCSLEGEDCKKTRRKCRISNWNKFEYEVEVDIGINDNSWVVGNTAEIIGRLRGGPDFRNFSVSLTTGDRISFTGLIQAGGNGLQPKEFVMRAVEGRCLDCASPVQSYPQATSYSAYKFMRTLFNFLFYPLALMN